jgi:ATP-dependent Clp protease ATP-binding subunit ClpA
MVGTNHPGSIRNLEEEGLMTRLNKQLDPARTGSEAAELDSNLRKCIVGQDEAIQEIVRVYQTHLAGMSGVGRPVGSFLFLGPTGSGKTRLVEATAESLIGTSRGVIKIDCGEFQHSHEIAKLVGSPPGYLGHRETHPMLSQDMLNLYHTETVKLSFVLFDEIEKASDALWNLLLGILDKANLTLGDNRRVDFSRCLIFMTGNLGAAEMNSILRPHLGFAAGAAVHSVADSTLDGKITRTAVEAARRKFTPEFLNRIDKTVVFQPLGVHELRRVLDLELEIVQQRILGLSSGSPFVFSLTDAAREFLLREGTDAKYGARHLKRAIDRNLVHPLSNLIATRQVWSGDLVRVDHDGTLPCLTFFKDAEDVPAYVMARANTSHDAPQGPFSVGATADPPSAARARSFRR